MPKSCCVPSCTTNKLKNPDVKFYILPNRSTEPSRRTQWLQAIQRKDKLGQQWDPTSRHVYVCSQHFVTGQKNDDLLSPDYVPSVFPVLSSLEKNKKLEKIENINRTQEAKRRRKKDDASSAAEVRLSVQDNTNGVQGLGLDPSHDDKLNTDTGPITRSAHQKGNHLKKPLKSLMDPQLLAPGLLAGLGKYVCSVCGEMFASLAQLARHVQFHDTDRPFLCTVCGKRFLSRSHHYEHQRVHTGERPFSCDRCERSFTTHHNLKRHLLTHDKEEVYRCTVCGVLFCQDHQLNNLNGIFHVLRQCENPERGHVMGIKTKLKKSNSSNEQEENGKKKKTRMHSQSEEDYSQLAEDESSSMSNNSDVSEVPNSMLTHVSEALNEPTLRIKRIAYDMEFIL